MANGTIRAVHIGATAAAWKTRGARFAAKLTVAAANAGLTRASKACAIIQTPAIEAAEGKAQDNFVFIDSVTATTHDS
jgi:hypothetical protein